MDKRILGLFALVMLPSVAEVVDSSVLDHDIYLWFPSEPPSKGPGVVSAYHAFDGSPWPMHVEVLLKRQGYNNTKVLDPCLTNAPKKYTCPSPADCEEKRACINSTMSALMTPRSKSAVLLVQPFIQAQTKERNLSPDVSIDPDQALLRYWLSELIDNHMMTVALIQIGLDGVPGLELKRPHYFFLPDYAGATRKMALHACRSASPGDKAVILANDKDKDPYFDYERARGFIAGLTEGCPASMSTESGDLIWLRDKPNDKANLRSLFTLHHRIKIIFAEDDDLTLSAMDAAKAVRKGGSAGLIFSSGSGGFDYGAAYDSWRAGEMSSYLISQRWEFDYGMSKDLASAMEYIIQAPTVVQMPQRIYGEVWVRTSTPEDDLFTQLSVASLSLNPSAQDLVPVTVDVVVEGTELDAASGFFRPRLLLTASWYDARLEWEDRWMIDRLRLTDKEVWRPSFMPDRFNNIGFEKLKSTLSASSDGMMTLRVLVEGGVDCRFDMTYFPRDEQSCEYHLRLDEGVRARLHAGMLESVPGLDLPGYLTPTLEWSTVNRTFYVTGEAVLKLRISAIRQLSPYFFSFILPTMLITAVLSVTLFMFPALETRCELTVSGVLTLSFLKTDIDAKLPPGGGFSWAEVWWIANLIYQSLLFVVFATGIDRAIAKRISKTEGEMDEDATRRVDINSMLIFWALYVFMSITLLVRLFQGETEVAAIVTFFMLAVTGASYCYMQGRARRSTTPT